jgi:pyridoxine kinase
MASGGSARVLLISSHVVHGHVGNKASVFPLQLLGLDVDFINSVQFSNHTGYPHGHTGDCLDGAQLLSLVDGLEANALLAGITHILTGYIGKQAFLEAVIEVVRRVKAVNRECVFICDPVLGDHGKYYVPREMVEVYRERVLPIADVITPNLFEAELLLGAPIPGPEAAVEAARLLHARGPRTIVFTSLEHRKPESLVTVCSRVGAGGAGGGSNSGQQEAYSFTFPCLPAYFTGTGDLFAALWLAWAEVLLPDKMPEAAEKVIATMQAVLANTNTPSNVTRELRLIQSKREIENPPTETANIARQRLNCEPPKE